jgi:hypothetical protein
MRTLSIVAFASFLVLWGFYSFVKSKQNEDAIAITRTHSVKSKLNSQSPTPNTEEETLLSEKKRRELDKIGSVINEDNADIDHETKDKIKVERKVFDDKLMLKEKQVLLEQSFMDKNSSVKDIKRLQENIVEMKNKLKEELSNSERWDPKFIYYLMLQENYTYNEINQIKSLSENGLNPEEINYITDLIKEDSFSERIQAYKNQTDSSGRTIASVRNKKPKEKDDFIEDPTQDGSSVESKLIEMNYNQEEKEEMVYGSHQ